jgi:(E)-4-hydroxy-3-methylbut-2-enyl-diphosphate synthase
VDELFAEIDKSLAAGRTVVDERKAAEGAEWLERIEVENADELTPERIAAMEAAAAEAEDGNAVSAPRDRAPGGNGAPRGGTKRPALDEDASPTVGRRFTRA